MTHKPQVYTVLEAAEMLKVDRLTIIRMISDDSMRAVKVGRQWRIPAWEIDRLIGPLPFSDGPEEE